jgi:hypothetical protein
MNFVEFLAGIVLFVGAVGLMQVARPREGVQPAFMSLYGMKTIVPFALLVGFCIGATFIIHGAILMLS